MSPIPPDIAAAVARLRAGRLVAFPTETVYALGADAGNPEAIARIFEAKSRPHDRPVAALVADEAMARRAAAHWPARAADLARRFWPGPLTLVVPRAAHLPGALTAGAPNVGLRCPDHPVALALIRAFGAPVAATSANRSGDVPPTTAADVRADLAGADVLILEDHPTSPTRAGVESTVLLIARRAGEPDAILRRGPIGPEELGGDVITTAATPPPSRAHQSTAAPAPQFALFDNEAELHAILARSPDNTTVIIALEGGAPLPGGTGVPPVSAQRAEPSTPPARTTLILLPPDPVACSAQFYTALREAQRASPARILIQRPDQPGPLWDAIRDRLMRLAQIRR